MTQAPPLVVVLAAGASRRLGEPKALCNIGGTTAIGGLIRRALAQRTGLRDLVVVTGRHHLPIREALIAETLIAEAPTAELPVGGTQIRATSVADALDTGGSETGGSETGAPDTSAPSAEVPSTRIPLTEVGDSKTADRESELDATAAPRRHGPNAPRVATPETGMRPTLDVQVLRNEDWARGRTGSFACAVRAHPDRDLLLAPIDVPRVSSRTFAALCVAWDIAGRPAHGWLASAQIGADRVRRFGHPIVVGRDLAARALALDPDASLRDLRECASPLSYVDVDDPAILEDLDTPADLARLRALEQPH